MKKLLILFSINAAILMADPGLIYLTRATVDPSAPRTFSLSNVPVTKDATALYLVAPEKNFTNEELDSLPRYGVRLDGVVPPNAYVVEIKSDSLDAFKRAFKFSYFGPYLPEYKLPFQAESINSLGEKKSLCIVGAIRDEYRPLIAQKMDELGISGYEMMPDCSFEPSVKAMLTPSEASALAAMPEVRFIEEYEEPMPECDETRSEQFANVEDMHIAGYRGEGEMVCIQDTGCDTGDMATIHPDLKQKRIIGRATTAVASQRGTYNSWYDAGTHGSHVTGCATGQGLMSDGQYRGMAPDADLFVLCAGSSGGGILSGTEYDITNVYHNGARVMNCSWGSGRGGNYGSGARFEDKMMWDMKDFVICHSAGNYNDNAENPTSRLNDQSAAKNTIVSGATIKHNYHDGVHQGLAGFSSRGPCADGRIKPDVVIPGNGIMASGYGHQTSSERDKYYYSASGTSMSSPLTAGCCIIIREYLRKACGVEVPNNSLVKAVLIAGARTLYPGQYTEFEEIANVRPNHMEGHGQVNLRESLMPKEGKMEFFEQTFTATDQAVTNTFEKGAGLDLTVALCWTDPPTASGAAKILINDLDLYVIDPNGTVYTRDDHLNNNEILHLLNSPAGTYKVVVKANSIMQGEITGSVVMNQSRNQSNGLLALAVEPVCKLGADSVELVLTNLEENCDITVDCSVSQSSERIYSFSEPQVTFAKTKTITLMADLARSTENYPVCEIKLNDGEAGAVVRRIGFPTGSDETGYTLYASRYQTDATGKQTGYDTAVNDSDSASERVGFLEPEYLETVFSEDFESYETDVNLIGQNGWTLGAGISTNGCVTAKENVVDGHANKYVEIERFNSVYAPHYKISGLQNGWSEAYEHSYLIFTFKTKMNGSADKSFSLWTPNTAELLFSRVGRKYSVKSNSSDGTHPIFYSEERIPADTWVDVELWIEFDNDMSKHVLRRVVIGDVAQDCYGVIPQSGRYDYFTILRFYQFGESNFAIDDLKIMQYKSDIDFQQAMKIAKTSDEGQESAKGVYINAGLDESHADDLDLIFDSYLSVDPDCPKVVIGQDPASRQFESELRCDGQKVSLYLTDIDEPTLITDTVPAGEFFRYGYRLNTKSGHKVLKKVFFGDKIYDVGKELKTSAGLATVDSFRIYPTEQWVDLNIESLSLRAEPFETAKLFVNARSFNLGEEVMTWSLTNSFAGEAINFTARITENPELFSVYPEEGTFNDIFELTIAAPEDRTRPGYKRGTVEIDAGAAGKKTLRFGCPMGNYEDGYLLYDTPVFEEGIELPEQDASWKCDASTSATGGRHTFRVEKLRASAIPFTDQGAFVQVGLPENTVSDLTVTVRCVMKFPEDFKGYFYLTQDEPHRQFQSAFTPANASGQKYAKLTLTDYTRNTGLMTAKPPLGEFVEYTYELSLSPVKKLERIAYYNQEKEEGYKIGGTKVSDSDGIDQFGFRLSTELAYVDIRDLTVTMGPYVPEPGMLFALLALLGLPCLRKYLLI